MADFYNHYTTEFNENWLLRIQQKPSKLAPFLSITDFDGEKKRFDRLGSVSVQERTMRNGPTPTQNVSTDSRWAILQSYDIPAHLVDREEAQNLGKLTLPNSDLVQSHAMAYNRKFDQQVLRKALGSVYTGTDGTTSTAFDSAYAVTAGSGLTVAKILEVREIMASADVDMDTAPIWVLHPKDVTDLINLTEVKSADYNTVKALAQGAIDTFCGFKFVQSTQVESTGSGYINAVFHPSALKVVRGGLDTRISEREDLSYATQIYSWFRMAVTRVHDEAVIKVTTTT